MRYLLDTNMCIYIIRRRPPQVIERLRQTQPGDVGVSAITASELEYGAAKSSRPAESYSALARFLAPLEVAPYGHSAAEAYGPIRAELEATGRLIGPLDLLIAAHARALGVTLLTNNEREFRRIPGLSVENWTV